MPLLVVIFVLLLLDQYPSVILDEQKNLLIRRFLQGKLLLLEKLMKEASYNE